MLRKFRCLTVVLTLALLSTGAAQARSLQLRSASPCFLDAIWHWLASHSISGLTAIWEKEGGSMDPDGRPLPPATPPATTDAGGDMDPNGRN